MLSTAVWRADIADPATRSLTLAAVSMTALAVRSVTPFTASLAAPATPEAAPATLPAAPRAAPATLEAALEAAPATPEAALRAASTPVAAALFRVEVATPITSLPVVRVSNMVRPAPISSAGTGLARAELASDFRIDRPLSFTRAIASPERADGATPSRSWPSVSARPTRAASASRCKWALDVMTGSPSPCGCHATAS